MGHEQEAPRALVDLRIGGVTAKATFPFAFSDLTESSNATQLLGNVNLDVVLE